MLAAKSLTWAVAVISVAISAIISGAITTFSVRRYLRRPPALQHGKVGIAVWAVVWFVAIALIVMFGVL